MRPPWLLLALLALGPSSAQQFVDALPSSGIAFRHEASKTPRKYLPETMGGGVALLDANLDGMLDVFFVNGARLEFPHEHGSEPSKVDPKYWNRLYLNRGEMRFEDATVAFGLQGRGYGMGAAVGDYDNDGDPDLFVTNASDGDVPAAVLYRNEEGATFRDVSGQAGVDVRGWATSAGFFDAENDGDLDIVVLRYMEWRFDVDRRCGMEASYGRTYCHPDLFPAVTNRFYRNNGDGTFTDASRASGIEAHAGKGLGVAFADYDRDGHMDFVVANDSHPQFVFRNRGDGTFSEEAMQAGAAYDGDGDEFAGMGVLFDDLDQDGWPDLLTTALSQERYSLLFNLGDQQFDYYTARSGLGNVTQFLAGWGLAVFDADGDGSREVFFANGHVMDNIEHSQPHVRYRQPPLLVSFDGRQVVDRTSGAGEIFLAAWASRGLALGDLDNDGLQDLVVSNLDGAPYIAHNVSDAGNRWIGVALLGCASNRDGLGARVTLEQEGKARQHRTVTRSGSYLSARDPRVFFGLGADGAPSRLTVEWPSGGKSVLERPSVDAVHRVIEASDCVHGTG